MSTKRHSILPAVDRSGPKPPVNLSSSVTISENAILLGQHSITIQSETVVHPRCRLESSLGSILINRRCILQERVHVGAKPANLETAKTGGVVVEQLAILEVGSVIEAGGTEIGEGTTVQVGSRIGSGAKIGKNCTITPMSVIAPGDIVPDNTVIYSNGLRRTDKRGIADMRKGGLLQHITVLRRMIQSNPDKFK